MRGTLSMKKLPFHKETIRQLSAAELSGIGGGHSHCGNNNSNSCNSCCNNSGGCGGGTVYYPRPNKPIMLEC